MPLRVQKINCTICGIEISKSNIKRHLDKHFGNHEKGFPCEVCERVLLTKQALERHKEIHNETRQRFQCETCGKKFVEEYNLKVHKQNAHSGDERERYACDSCSKQFLSKQYLKFHIVKDHGVAKKLPCKICNKEFTRQYCLSQHLKTHEENRETVT